MWTKLWDKVVAVDIASFFKIARQKNYHKIVFCNK